eukprot:scaffold148569_cov21-Prasinocladus_malaysianus.AAC.2
MFGFCVYVLRFEPLMKIEDFEATKFFELVVPNPQAILQQCRPRNISVAKCVMTTMPMPQCSQGSPLQQEH